MFRSVPIPATAMQGTGSTSQRSAWAKSIHAAPLEKKWRKYSGHVRAIDEQQSCIDSVRLSSPC